MGAVAEAAYEKWILGVGQVKKWDARAGGIGGEGGESGGSDFVGAARSHNNLLNILI